MGLYGLSTKKQQELICLQKIVLSGNAPDRLIMSETQLRQAAAQMAENDIRIVNDSITILNSTTVPDTFFSRLQELAEKANELAHLEPFVRFQGGSPTAALMQFVNQREECVGQFLLRCYSNAYSQAELAKTNKGKISIYQKYYDALLPYYSQMEQKNRAFVETRFAGSIKLLQ